jgi:predicted nucleic acid-binding protein
VCLRKLRPPLALEEARREVERLFAAFPVLPLTAPVIGEALRGVGEHGFSYYDAQVWATARLGQVPVILSEDFNPGATVEGVLFEDPFSSGFDLAALR